jgi:hypothetical protein
MPCHHDIHVRCLTSQAKEARKEREAQIAKVQMEAALSKGVSWGMGVDNQVCTLHCHCQTYHRCFHPR